MGLAKLMVSNENFWFNILCMKLNVGSYRHSSMEMTTEFWCGMHANGRNIQIIFVATKYVRQCIGCSCQQIFSCLFSLKLSNIEFCKSHLEISKWLGCPETLYWDYRLLSLTYCDHSHKLLRTRKTFPQHERIYQYFRRRRKNGTNKTNNSIKFEEPARGIRKSRFCSGGKSYQLQRANFTSYKYVRKVRAWTSPPTPQLWCWIPQFKRRGTNVCQFQVCKGILLIAARKVNSNRPAVIISLGHANAYRLPSV